jgi:hypothetical protein
MEVLDPCCCGLDVHKKSITACVLWAQRGGSRKEKRDENGRLAWRTREAPEPSLSLAFPPTQSTKHPQPYIRPVRVSDAHGPNFTVPLG